MSEIYPVPSDDFGDEPIKKKVGRPKKTEEERIKSTIYVQRYREKHGSYTEAQKKAFKKWQLKIKQLTGAYPSAYNKTRLRDLK